LANVREERVVHDERHAGASGDHDQAEHVESARFRRCAEGAKKQTACDGAGNAKPEVSHETVARSDEKLAGKEARYQPDKNPSSNFPAEALKAKKLKEIRLELVYIPSPYKEETLNFVVSVGGR
jgi:hypothetical protein